MESEKKYPRIGVGVIVSQNGKILFGKRKGAHGTGLWSFPGGHLEFGETPEECVARELAEEVGISPLKIRRGPWVNNFMEGKHYITIFMLVEAFEGVIQNLEPDKCDGWSWFDPEEIPTPLFYSIRSLMSEHPQVLSVLYLV